MNEPAAKPPAVLDYATYAADGLPVFVPGAEAMIDAQQRPKRIRKYFPNAKQAVKYFAKSMRRRHPLQPMRTACEICGQAPCAFVTAAGWRVEMPLKWNEFRLSQASPSEVFNTFHTVCPNCYAQWRKRFGLWRRGAMLLGWIALFATIALFTLRWWVMPAMRHTKEWATMIPPALMLGVIGVRFLAKILLPAAYPAAIGLPPGMKCIELSALVDRPQDLDSFDQFALLD